MMRFRAVFVVLTALSSLVLAGCSFAANGQVANSRLSQSRSMTLPPDSDPQVIQLKYAHQGAPFSWEAVHSAQPWLDQVTEATGGRVKIDAYYSQTLTKGTDAWGATKNNITDLAWMFHGYWANMTPLADVVSLPLLPFTSAKQASGIFWQLYERYPTMTEEFRDNHVLLGWASTPYFLITNKKQVKTVDDFRGLKIRVPSGPPVEMMKLLGAVPVTMGMPDTYISLQKGVIDGMAIPWEAILSYRQFEVARYYTYAPLFTVYFTLAMNNEKWDSLPSEIQSEIESVSGLRGSLAWGENTSDAVVSVGRETALKQGCPMEEYRPTAEELANLTEIAGKPIWDSWVKNMSGQGHPEASEILSTTLDMIRTYP
jgi:TRAP-type transport system periplasmic protein